MTESDKKPRWYKRVGWLLLIWILSVMALLIVTIGLKLIMSAVGFKV